MAPGTLIDMSSRMALWSALSLASIASVWTTGRHSKAKQQSQSKPTCTHSQTRVQFQKGKLCAGFKNSRAVAFFAKHTHVHVDTKQAPRRQLSTTTASASQPKYVQLLGKERRRQNSDKSPLNLTECDRNRRLTFPRVSPWLCELLKKEQRQHQHQRSATT